MRDNDIIDVNYIFVRSPNSIAFWKFHKVIVNKLSIKPNSTFLSNLPVISNHTCISFSIYTKGYAVTLYMTNSNNTNEIIKQEKFKKTEPWFEYNWINVKFYSHDIKVKSVNINISLTGEEVNFSSLRFCEKQGMNAYLQLYILSKKISTFRISQNFINDTKTLSNYFGRKFNKLVGQ